MGYPYFTAFRSQLDRGDQWQNNHPITWMGRVLRWTPIRIQVGVNIPNLPVEWCPG